MRIVVGVAGASGSVLALRTLQLLRAAGAETHLVVSAGGRLTARHELGADGPDRLVAAADRAYGLDALDAPIASGSFAADAMVIVPCSMRSLVAVSLGLDDNLLTRAAGVMLKERRRLVVSAREAPLTEAHLTAMLALTRMGAIVAPPVPPFYAAPETLDDLVRELAARLVGWLGVDPGPALTRWSGPAA
jgi:4-hydroxy-3-polyprenylbenzoate decarboxylase